MNKRQKLVQQQFLNNEEAVIDSLKQVYSQSYNDITKKVADKLTSLYNTDREHYEKCWKDVSTFVKFGCIKDNDFYDKVEKIILFKNLNGRLYYPFSHLRCKNFLFSGPKGGPGC